MTAPQVNPYEAPRAAVDPPPVKPGAGSFVYRSLAGPAELITAALALMIVIELGWTASAHVDVGVAQRWLDGGDAEEAWQDLNDGLRREQVARQAHRVAMALAAVGFCLLLPRANRNARAFGCSALRFTPRWSAGVFFVPIWNLYKPYQAVRELWQASETGAGVTGTDAPAPILLKFWWGGWLGVVLFSPFISQVGGWTPGAGGPLAYHQARQVLCLIGAATAALGIVVVRQLAARFDHCHQQLATG